MGVHDRGRHVGESLESLPRHSLILQMGLCKNGKLTAALKRSRATGAADKRKDLLRRN